jgi:thimet oligopeptidase
VTAAVLVLAAAGPAEAGMSAAAREAFAGGTGLTWRLSTAEIGANCAGAIAAARARIAAAARDARASQPAMASLVAVETAIADLNDALIAERLLVSVAGDQAVRAASARCNEGVAAFGVGVAADTAVFALAEAAQGQTQAERQLAKLYLEAGRRAGAHLRPAVRKEISALLERLNALQVAYQQALVEAGDAIEITADEAAGLPRDIVAAFEATAGGYVVPVDFSPLAEQFLKHAISAAARRRFQETFFNRGGEANSRRVGDAVALRHEIARLAGRESWAAWQLDTKMARTPGRALTLLREVDARLMPRAREEIRELAALKRRAGDDSPFAAWDYAFYRAELERTRYAVDAEAVRRHFPVAHVVPATLEIFEALLGVRFHAMAADDAWAAGVGQYAITDAAGGAPIGWFFLDLAPRPGKFQRPATFALRPGRSSADGAYVLPVSSIIGSGPSGGPSRPALFSHRDVSEFLHEFGHVMHSTLSTARYATLYGTSVRGDFVETPSQMLENWAWQPATLRRLSRHVETGEPLPDPLIENMLAARHVDAGVYWTRQAFLGIYDLTLHSSGADVDADALWFELMPELTPLPPVPGTRPAASFLPVMGGYDAGYYGYVWSKVYAQDLFSAFERAGLADAEVGLRYRREILEPGGTAEPGELLRNFLGRAASYEPFYRDLGLSPAAPR